MGKERMDKAPVRADSVKLHIGTYPPGEPSDLPMFFEKKPYQGATGKVYPIPFCDTLSDEKQDVEYDAIELENEYLALTILPKVGGKVLRAFDKCGQYDFIYYNSVIKPAMIGLAGPWVSGGIEFNWPQHHRPTTFMPLDACIEHCSNGEETAWVGEVEPINRMKGMAGMTVCPGRSFFKAKVQLYNGTAFPQPFMWWANLAVPVNDHYRISFPPDVEYVNDHDRRAVVGWPVAKGVYRTARPFDYGEATDLTEFGAIKVPSSFMVSEGQSQMDFVSGYDHKKKMGVVAFADHHIAPGKKLFHWGVGDFGEMWCSNLTDEDGPYVELMTGAYTDNQPDFAWIMPHETKCFEQYWYPVHDIGDVKNATVDAAVNMEQIGSELFIGVQATGVFEKCLVRLAQADRVVWEETVDMDPAHAYTRRIPMDAEWRMADLAVSVYNAQRELLVAYKQPKRGERKPIEPRQPAPRPGEIATLDELFFHAMHLEQYKQHNYDPRDYYREALRRDPGDARCNTGMGRLALKAGDFAGSLGYLDKAIERITSRNGHPSDVEAFYLKGLVLRHMGRTEEAEEWFCRAMWKHDFASAACYELARLYALKGEMGQALDKLDQTLRLSPCSLRARNLRCAILRSMGKAQQAYEEAAQTVQMDKLDLWARVEMRSAASQAGRTQEVQQIAAQTQEIFPCQAEDLIDIACEYMYCGLYPDALDVLEGERENYPLAMYYAAFIESQMGADPAHSFAKAAANESRCFPSRLDDIQVLQFAITHAQRPARACYLLGCLYYDKFRFDEAIALWEKAITLDDAFANAYRNLSLAYFDKRRDARSARICISKAFALRPDNARIFYEYQQLLKNNAAPIAQRLALYEENWQLAQKRDDCYLEYVMLLTMYGRYQEAVDLLKGRCFHIYEGGEGKLTQHHAWIHVLWANQLAHDDPAQAEEIYRAGAIIPRGYGEAKSYFAQESHIYYFLGMMLRREGRQQEAQKALEAAAEYKAAVSEISLFRALALQQLEKFSLAQQVLQEMLEVSRSKLQNADLYPYFGVGSPTPMPFDSNIVKNNTMDGLMLKAYALLGLGRMQEAEQTMDQARAIDPWDMRVYTFDQIKALV